MLLRQMYRDMGYTTHEVELDSWDFGSIEQRKRWFLVAATHGIEIDLTDLVPKVHARPKLGQFLDKHVEPDRWNKMEGLKSKEVRDREAGKGFAMQIVTPDSVKIGTIGKDYNKNRSTEPKVQHDTMPEYLRLLTPTEHARIKDFPVSAIEGLSNTAAHQLLGQAVDCRPVKALFKRIGECVARAKGTSVATVLPYSLGRATG
jgi:DNA (cytosine-5)-methyltransferase 1